MLFAVKHYHQVKTDIDYCCKIFGVVSMTGFGKIKDIA
jgi:hypothetical protein